MRIDQSRLLLTALALVSFGIVVVLRTPLASTEDQLRDAAATETIDDATRLRQQGLVEGHQLVAVYFGGSRCLRCAANDQRRAIASLRSTLQSGSAPQFAHVTVVGVAVNVDIREGLAFLEGFGPDAFDEISTGGGWANDFARRYLWGDSLRAVTVPRLVLVARRLTAQLDPMSLTFSGDTVLGVLTGSREIARWIADGARVASPPTK